MIQVNAVLPSPGLADSSLLSLRFNLRARDIYLGRRPLSLYFRCSFSVGNPHPGETKIQAQRKITHVPRLIARYSQNTTSYLSQFLYDHVLGPFRVALLTSDIKLRLFAEHLRPVNWGN
jgi:hypothetical protein